MAYTKTSWGSQTPIKQEYMNNIEQGIESAHNNISSLSSQVQGLSTTVAQATTDVSGYNSRIQTLEGWKTDKYTIYNQTVDDVTALNTWKSTKEASYNNAVNNAADSWSAIEAARDTYNTLKARLDALKRNIDTNNTNINNDLQNAIDALNNSIDTKASKTSVNTNTQNISDIAAALGYLPSLTGTYTDLVTRLSAMNNTITTNYNDSIGYTDQAIIDRTVTVTVANAIKERLDYIDGGRVDTTSSISDYNHAIRLGILEDAVIKDPLSGNSNIKSNVNKLLNEVNEAHRSNIINDTLDTRFDSIDYEISHSAIQGDNTTGIKERLTEAETNIQTIANELGMISNETIQDTNTRIDNITDEILEAHVQTGLDTQNNPIYQYEDLNERFSAVEQTANAAAIKDEVDTSLQNLDDRLDTVEGVAASAATAEALNAALEDIDTRFDAIDGADSNTIASRLTAVENTIGDNTNGLAVTNTIANEAKNAIGDNSSGLTKRVKDLEDQPKSATVIINNLDIIYENGIPISIGNPPEVPSSEKDYLLQGPIPDTKYYYWKYIGEYPDGNWELISGAGNSSEVELPENIINAINVSEVSIDNAAEQDKWPSTQSFSGGLEVYTTEDVEHENNLLADFVAVRNARIQNIYDDNNEVESQKLQILDTNGKLMEYEIVGGGASGAVNLYNARIDSSTPASRSIPSNNTDPVTISAKVIIQQGNVLLPNATAEGNIQYRKRGTTTWNTGNRIENIAANIDDEKYIILNDTIFNVDITKYLQEDITMEFRIALSIYPTGEEADVFSTYSSIFRVTQVNISIKDESFDYGSVKNSNFLFSYRCYGQGITKIVHFLLDGEEAVTPITTISHNEVLSQIIPITNILENKTASEKNTMHTFQVYFVTDAGLESNKLNYHILYNTDNERLAPMIGASVKNTSIMDGDELVVNYSVNTIGFETTDKVEIELYTMNGQEKNSIQTDILTNVKNNRLIDPPYKTFNYPSLSKVNPSDPDPDPLTVYIKFTATHNELSDSQTVSVQVNYLDTKYNLIEETNNLIFKYNAYGRSNNNIGKERYTYTYTTVGGQELEFIGTFNNFNWATDGYVDGESLTIGGGATLNINVPIFSTQFNNVSIETDPNIEKITTNGRTIEIDYEVLSTTNMNATIIDCMTTDTYPKGFRVTPQNCYLLNSGSNIDIDETGFIKNEENVAAAYLNPGTRTHLVLVIEPTAKTLAADNTYHQSANIYINGEFANSCPYNIVGNDFDNEATITIGSDTCLIKIYSIKLYNRGLTATQVLHNYEVAPIATRDKIERLEDNDVLDSLGRVDYEKARKKYTCLLLTGMGTVNGVTVPTMAPYKGYPSVVGRTKNGEAVGKTESGLLLTKPSTVDSRGYTIEFDLQDKLVDNGLYGYACSNNVQGTSSQKFPVKNLKVYLAKGKAGTEVRDETIDIQIANTTNIITSATAAYIAVHGSEATIPDYIINCASAMATMVENSETEVTQSQIVDAIVTYLTKQDADVGAAYISAENELSITHPIIPGVYTKSDKVKYALRGNVGLGDSTLCWKADYMSTDHANTFNANIANTLYTEDDRLSDRWTDKTQFTVYGIKCLLFQQNGPDATPEFVGDGCLNNDKGNHETFGLETKEIANIWPGDENNNTMCQKWDFRNNTNSLLFFKHDGLFEIIDEKPAVTSCLECIYPDEGDLTDAQELYKQENGGATDPTLDVNYNHFQILSSWLGNRANYWYETDTTKREIKKQIFINEFRNHFNFNHILIYYLFMEYTALCDNRVKNIHMRTDNAGEEKIRIKNSDLYYFEGNSNPNSGPWTLAENLETRTMQEPIMDENGNYQFDQSGNMVLGNIRHVFVKDSVLDTIDWEQGEGHSNFAIWAPVLYDLDSCFGAENVGYLKVRYDANWNYSLYNKLQFAGFDSILWLQVEDCFQTELKAMAKTLYNRATGLNYTTFYRQQIIDNLASLCPAITNQDMILKYEIPWTEGYLDYSQDTANPTISTDEYKYLQRGTRTAQKATFMKQRSMLLSSKYDGNEFKQDKITFRAGTLVNQANAIITLTANQKLYHGVQYGDLNDVSKVTRRANKIYNAATEQWVNIDSDTIIPEFVPCQIQNIGDMGNTDGIEIYGASVLNDIGDLSRFHPYQLDVGKAVNLKKLIIGSSTAGFSNTSTTKIDGLNNCALLEEINICNLKNLTALSLTNNGFIKKVFATGSGLNTLALPRGGVLDSIAYGENTTDITIINQSRLTNFSYENSENNNYENVTRLWIENTPNIPIVDIILKRNKNLTSGIRLIGIDIELGNDSTFLEYLASDFMKNKFLSSDGGRKDQTPQITGRIGINKVRASLLNKIRERYGDDLVIEVHQQTITENIIRFYNEDILYKTFYLTADETIPDPTTYPDPITGQILPLPEKEADRQATYTFSHWKTATGQILESGMLANNNYNFYAQYSATPQYYTLVWKDGNVTLTNIPNLTYNQSLTAYTSPSRRGEGNLQLTTVKYNNGHYYAFKGWDKALTVLNEENFDLTNNTAIVNAIWEESTIDFNNEINITDFSQLNAADLYGLGQLNGDTRQRCLENYRGRGIVNFTLGHDFNYSNILSNNLLSNQILPYTLNGNINKVITYNNINNEIYPLRENESFTLALDFTMLQDAPSSVSETILASCYYNNNNTTIHGFKITYDVTNSQIRVYWGDNTNYVTIEQGSLATNDGYRNIIVLSHEANSNALNIYYRIPSYTNALPGAVTTTILTRENYTPINVPLILGGNYLVNTNTGEIQNIIENDDRSYVRRPAKAQIHFMKYWHAALRSDDCAILASWPHEQVAFVLTGYDNGGSTETNTITVGRSSKLNFASVSVIGDRGYYWSNQSTDIANNNIAGWHNSSIKNYCQTVIYSALPTTLQSILYTNQIPCVVYEYINNSSGYPQWQKVQSLYTDSSDIYLPSAKELGDLTNNEATLSWPTIIRENVIVYKDSGTQNRAELGTPSNELLNQIQKVRFYGKQVEFNNVIFTTTNDPAGYNYNNISIVLEEGNYWLRPSDQTMYVYSNNAWKPAIIWSTRTIILRTAQEQLTPQNFERISSGGILSVPSGSYDSVPDATRGLCIEFAIGSDSV